MSRKIIIVGGPAGCGKSTIAAELAKKFGLVYIEGDNLHPPFNVEKMSRGVPLTDDDRWDWLQQIATQSQLAAENASDKQGVVTTCSALKRKYRCFIRQRVQGFEVYFLMCDLSEESCLARVSRRQGHYMKESMVASQFRDYELPDESESDHVFVLNVEVPEDDVRHEILRIGKVNLQFSSRQ